MKIYEENERMKTISSVHVKNSKKKMQVGKPQHAVSKTHIPMTRNKSKRIVRTKSTFKQTKHTLKKVCKISGRKRKRQIQEKVEMEEDSQEDKENNIPTPVAKKGLKRVKSGSKHKKRNIKNSYEKSIKKEISEDENSGKQSVKRMSLKKKPATVLVESASKVSMNESVKEESEGIKTPTSSDLPKSSYSLRKRGKGRKLKKSHVYKSEENIIFSHEKEEEMNKLDDSEFKLPNEDKSRIIQKIAPHSLLEEVQKETINDIN